MGHGSVGQMGHNFGMGHMGHGSRYVAIVTDMGHGSQAVGHGSVGQMGHNFGWVAWVMGHGMLQ